MRTSLKDIAAALNVSKTTVSWVLSGRGDENKISIAMQEKIKKYAESIDYHPNLLAKSLISGKTNTIGLVVPSIADTFYAHIAKEVELEAEKLGYTVTFCSSEGDLLRESKMIRMLKAKQVDGLIIAATENSKDEIESLKKEHYPFVLIDRFFPELETSYVIVDNKNGARCVIEKLIDKGYKKIVFISSDTHLVVMKMRYQGYLDAIDSAAIPFDDQLVIDIKRDDYENDIIEKLDDLFDKNTDIDALFFATHYLALEALRYFYKRNIDINNKIGLGCFHKSSSLSIIAPQMIIVEQPISLMGKECTNILVESIKDKKAPVVQRILPMGIRD